MREIGDIIKCGFCVLIALLFLAPTVPVTGWESVDVRYNGIHKINDEGIIDGDICRDKLFELPENAIEISMDPSILSEIRDTGVEIKHNDIDREHFIRENPEYSPFNTMGFFDGLFNDKFVRPSGIESYITTTAGSTSCTRGEPRVEDDLELWNIQWVEKNSAWCEHTDPEPQDYPDDPPNWYQGNQASIGSFIADQKTRITVSVMNHGTSTVINVPVNISIYDYVHSGQPMKPNPTTLTIPAISGGQTATVTYDFTPLYATTMMRIAVYVDWRDDPDASDNSVAWNNRYVL
jgi:hypothetical protein